MSDSSSLLSVGDDLRRAAESGNVEAAREVCRSHTCDVNCKDYKGQTPLFYACSQGHLEMVQMLTSEFSADRTVKDVLGHTAAMVAALGGHGRVVEALLDDHDSISFHFNEKDNEGRTLFHHACAGGDIGLVEILISIYQAMIKAFCENVDDIPFKLAVIEAGEEELLVSLLNKKIIKYPIDMSDNYRSDMSRLEGLIFTYKVVRARDNHNDTPLHMAASCGHGEVVLMLINEFNCELNVKGYLDRTLLHSACSGGNATLAKALIVEHSVNINALDVEKDTPLHVAASCGHREVVIMLVSELKCELNISGHLYQSLLHSACSGGNTTLVKVLIVEHSASIDARNVQNDTPLHVAASCGHTEVVLMLIKEFKCDLNVRGHLDRTLLHSACSGGNVTLVKALIADHNVDINAQDAQNDMPLHVAASCGHFEVVLMLIDEFNCDHKVQGYLNQTLLHSACSGGNLSLVWTLIIKYEADVSVLDDQKYTPLHTAVSCGHQHIALALIRDLYIGTSILHIACSVGNLNMVKAQLSAHRESINDCDDEGNTPLHVAALWGQEEVISLLIYEFSATLEITGHLGRSLLHSACIGGKFSIVLTLGLTLDMQDKQSNTPLHVAALYGKDEVIKSLLCNFDINTKGHLGRTLLHCACSEGHLSLVHALFNHKADSLYRPDDDGNTPLHVATLCGKDEVIKSLLDDFDINTRGHLGRTLLHCACSEDHLSLVKTLIDDHNADVNLLDDEDNTPLHVAALCGKEEIVLALIDMFGCDPTVKGFQDRSLLHSACIGGCVDLVKSVMKYMDYLLVVDLNGNTPLHTSAEFSHVGCVEALLSNDAPILMRNNSGKTPIDIATGEAKVFLDSYVKIHRNTIYHGYDTILKKAKKKYSDAQRIIRIFVIGNPGAGKSSLVETLKREKIFNSLWRVSKSSVPLHTAGIIPSIYNSKHHRRVLFYDFAGDTEYYSSHAAIFESLAKSNKGDNIFIIVIDLNEDKEKIEDIIEYWTLFIQNQSFDQDKISFIVVGSHLDTIPKAIKSDKVCQFEDICREVVSSDRFSYFTLDCCKPQSSKLLKNQIISLTKESPRHKLSLEAIILLGLLEKDFSHVISCSIQTIISHIRQTGINLPLNSESLHSFLCELQDIGLLLVITCNDDEKQEKVAVFDNIQVVLNISQLTNEVHKRLFSKSSADKILRLRVGSSEPYFNIGIIPLSVLTKALPKYITKECLTQLQYCQEISHEGIAVFPNVNFSDLAEQSFLFFPALCTAQKNEVLLKSDENVKCSSSIGWLAKCTNDCFPPRFLHVLLLRLVFNFTLGDPLQAVPPEHRVFHHRCTMWTTGVHWLTEDGEECMVEVVNANKGVAIVIKGEKEAKEYIPIFTKLIDFVIASAKKYCQSVKYDSCLLDSTSEADYFNGGNLFALSDLKRILAEGKSHAISLSGKIRSKEPLHIYKLMKSHRLVDKYQSTDFAGYVLSLPLAVHPHLDHQLDQDSEEDTDLAEIAHHMLDWEQKLSTHLKLTEEDRREIQDQHSTPELQSCEVLRRWKKNQMPHATYGNLLQVFVDAGHAQCAEALCEMLRNKGSPSTNYSTYVSSLPDCARPHLELQLDWGHEGVEEDLIEIAQHMIKWEEKLVVPLGLTEVDVHDITEGIRNLVLQRREALRRWKIKQGLKATYGNLLELFVKAGHTLCAEAVYKVIKDKYE